MILLQLDKCRGDSNIPEYEKWIACTSVSWNIERTFSESAKAGTHGRERRRGRHSADQRQQVARHGLDLPDGRGHRRRLDGQRGQDTLPVRHARRRPEATCSWNSS